MNSGQGHKDGCKERRKMHDKKVPNGAAAQRGRGTDILDI
jgi:hypothetical protein